MCVGQENQGKGIGAALLEEFEKIARRHNCTQLIVETSQARKYYEMHGFVYQGALQDLGVEASILTREVSAI